MRRARTISQADGAEFLTVTQAAQLVQVSATTIREWCRRGKLRRYGEGRLVRVRRADVLRVLEGAGAPGDEMDARVLSILQKAGA